MASAPAAFLVVGMLSIAGTPVSSRNTAAQGRRARLSAAFLVITLSSIGLPRRNGFIGEFLVLLGTFFTAALRGIRGHGRILSAGHMLWMVQRVYLRRGDQPEEREAVGPEPA
jgi:NADH-quinone oxidoreductase subunit M